MEKGERLPPEQANPSDVADENPDQFPACTGAAENALDGPAQSEHSLLFDFEKSAVRKFEPDKDGHTHAV